MAPPTDYVRKTGTVEGIGGSQVDVGVDYGAVTLLTGRDAVRLDGAGWQKFLTEFFLAITIAGDQRREIDPGE